MLVATILVALVPVALAWMLRSDGVISDPWLSMLLAVGLSLAASSVGSWYWRKRRDASDLLFSELLIWGWLWRWRMERQLSSAARMLDLPASNGVHLSIQRREQLLRRLATALEAQDRYLSGHSRRVARHSTMIARRLGLPKGLVAEVRAAAAIHDVGKLRVPAHILNKPGKLTAREFAIVKRHSADGAQLVASLGDPGLTAIVRHHHERLDGHGYPSGLSGEEIPLGARIIAVADTFDAITSTRPYREARRHKHALDTLHEVSGTQLDPRAVRAFLSYYSGRRPLALWTASLGTLQRAFSWMSAEQSVAATVPAGNLAAVVAATAALGLAAASTPLALRSDTHSGPTGLAAQPARAWAAPGTVAKRAQGSARTAGGGTPGGAAAQHRGHPFPGARGAVKTSAGAPVAHRLPRHHAVANPVPGSTGTSGNTTSGNGTSGNPTGATQGGPPHGHAFGHYKSLGRGHGRGHANGHYKSHGRGH